MADGRQASEWPQAMALIWTVRNLFSKHPFDITKLMPSHLIPKQTQEQGMTAEEMAPAWRGGLKQAIMRGAVK